MYFLELILYNKIGDYMYKRNETTKVNVGNIQIGNSDEIVIQTMCTVKTENIEEVINEIKQGESSTQEFKATLRTNTHTGCLLYTSDAADE